MLDSAQSAQSVLRPAQGIKSGNMESVHVPTQRTKSSRPAHDKIPLGTLYQQYLCDTRDKSKTMMGLVRGKIHIAEMYHRYLRSRSLNANHQ